MNKVTLRECIMLHNQSHRLLYNNGMCSTRLIKQSKQVRSLIFIYLSVYFFYSPIRMKAAVVAADLCL